MRSITATSEFTKDLRGIGKSLLKLSSIAAWVIDLLTSEKAKWWRPSTACRRLGVLVIRSAYIQATEAAIMQKSRWLLTACGCRVCVSALPISRLSSLKKASIFHHTTATPISSSKALRSNSH